MDLKKFYYQNIQESEYHHRFYTMIVDDNEFEVYDDEEAIAKFKELCQPEIEKFTTEQKSWFYLITYYLHKMGYELKEFPRVLERPPVDPIKFTYGEIRDRIIAQRNDGNKVVPFEIRRDFVAGFTFEFKASLIDINESIKQMLKKISPRQVPFNELTTDEKLVTIPNALEHLLKKGKGFITPDYSKICFDYITDDMITKYRKRLQCFRHATDTAIEERNFYSKEQKDFFIDYGLTIINVIYSLLK